MMPASFASLNTSQVEILHNAFECHGTSPSRMTNSRPSLEPSCIASLFRRSPSRLAPYGGSCVSPSSPPHLVFKFRDSHADPLPFRCAGVDEIHLSPHEVDQGAAALHEGASDPGGWKQRESRHGGATRGIIGACSRACCHSNRDTPVFCARYKSPKEPGAGGLLNRHSCKPACVSAPR